MGTTSGSTRESLPDPLPAADVAAARRGTGCTAQVTSGSLWLTVVLFLASLLSPVDYTGSDAQGTLLTAQALLHTGTLRLDQYVGYSYVPARTALGEATGKYRLIRGHCYNWFPVGTSLASLPFVCLANLRGEDMIEPQDDAELQNVVSACVVALSTLLVFLICRCFAREGVSLALTAAMIAGSPLISTNGTALWSSGFATLFSMLGLLLLMRHIKGDANLRPWFVGACLGLATLCRPTAAIPAFCMMSLLAMRNVRAAGAVLAGMGVVFLPLVAYSVAEFGEPLPEYYVPIQRLPRPTLWLVGLAGTLIASAAAYRLTRGVFPVPLPLRPRIEKAAGLAAGAAVLAAIVAVGAHDAIGRRFLPSHQAQALSAVNGCLLSPSRGLLVFCPYLVIVGIVLAVRYRRVRRDHLFWLAVAWLGLHWAAVARPSRWYGGHCFGPRIFAEAFPAAIILVLVAWELLSEGVGRWSRLGRRSLVLGFALGLFIHTYQGLFNMWPARWNSSPDIDMHEPDLFRWQYAQFLASPSRVERRQVHHGTSTLSWLPMGYDATATDSATVYFRDVPLEVTDSAQRSRRTSGLRSALWVKPGPEVERHATIVLHLRVAADSPHRVIVRVNGHLAPPFDIEWREASWCAVEVPGRVFTPNIANEIAFEVRPTRPPGANRRPGMRFWSLRLSGQQS